MRTRSIITGLLLGSLTLAACGGDGGGGGPNPTPGTLDVVLTSAPLGPGAIMFTVSGGEITGVTSNYTKYEANTAANSRKVLLTGDITSGTMAQISVPDVAKEANYVVTVLQVAARATHSTPYAQLGTGGYNADVQ
jgi:hypothetical protein